MQVRLGRYYLTALALVALLLLGALAMLALDRTMRVSALAETREAATSQAAILAAGLESELNTFTLVPRVLAVDPEVATLLAQGETAPGTRRDLLNRRLAELAEQTGAAAIYLMDAEGMTLAASNWGRPDSFVGSQYSFRDYFTGALAGGTASEFALGTVSRRPGLYLAKRVGPAESPLGVVAVKVEFDSLEAKWRNAEDGVFVTDREGVVLLASDPEWRFRSVGTPGEARALRDPERDSVRFGTAQLSRLDLPANDAAGLPVQFIEKVQSIAPTGWQLHLLADPAPRVSAALANGRLAGLSALALIAILGAALWVWLRQRQVRAADDVAAQTALLREQLRQANRLATLGQITAGLGHEIRQPLAAMQVYADSGQRLLDAGRTQEAAENFGKIAGLVGRIGAITKEQLHFGRRSQEEPRDVTISEVIDASLLLLGDQIRQLGMTLDLPDAEAAASVVRARHVQLEQVLVNLLQNAMQACGENGRIRLSVALDGGTVRLSVCDDGPGVPEGICDTLFQPFATSKSDGIGLGLAISRDIMRQLGGDLVLEDTATGACFTMRMPSR